MKQENMFRFMQWMPLCLSLLAVFMAFLALLGTIENQAWLYRLDSGHFSFISQADPDIEPGQNHYIYVAEYEPCDWCPKDFGPALRIGLGNVPSGFVTLELRNYEGDILGATTIEAWSDDRVVAWYSPDGPANEADPSFHGQWFYGRHANWDPETGIAWGIYHPNGTTDPEWPPNDWNR